MKQWFIKFAYDVYIALSRACAVSLVMAAASVLMHWPLTMVNCLTLYLMASMLLLRNNDLAVFQRKLLVQAVLMLLIYAFSLIP